MSELLAVGCATFSVMTPRFVFFSSDADTPRLSLRRLYSKYNDLVLMFICHRI